MPTDSLDRFIKAQETSYATALAEIRNGRKQSHWMWYIFPQLKGLGFSETSRYYGIDGPGEARAYLDHPVLGPRLIEISEALLETGETDARLVFGTPDDLKLRSCMSLFSSLQPTHAVFEKVLERFFGGTQALRH